jgi:hypothetical protein
MHEGRRYRAELQNLQSDNQVRQTLLVVFLVFGPSRFGRSTSVICMELFLLGGFISTQRRLGASVLATRPLKRSFKFSDGVARVLVSD